MRERYVNILAALRERYVGASTALRERYVGASIALREGKSRCLSAMAEIQSIPRYKYSSILPFKLDI